MDYKLDNYEDEDWNLICEEVDELDNEDLVQACEVECKTALNKALDTLRRALKEKRYSKI